MRILINMILTFIFWLTYAFIYSKFFKDQISSFPSFIKIGVEYAIPIIILLAMVFWRAKDRTRTS